MFLFVYFEYFAVESLPISATGVETDQPEHLRFNKSLQNH